MKDRRAQLLAALSPGRGIGQRVTLAALNRIYSFLYLPHYRMPVVIVTQVTLQPTGCAWLTSVCLKPMAGRSLYIE
jgi:hypothetical protein